MLKNVDGCSQFRKSVICKCKNTVFQTAVKEQTSTLVFVGIFF